MIDGSVVFLSAEGLLMENEQEGNFLISGNGLTLVLEVIIWIHTYVKIPQAVH